MEFPVQYANTPFSLQSAQCGVWLQPQHWNLNEMSAIIEEGESQDARVPIILTTRGNLAPPIGESAPSEL